ncbi:MAG TPA: hypothetical protein VHD76_17745 [Bryobacteraceae bacterium]|jgi:uncharacterized membrane protein|nr:hypothetical protein [Bryobacteraceae bacterium]
MPDVVKRIRQDDRKIEARWPSAVAVIAAGWLNMGLPAAYSAGPHWLLLVLVLILLPPAILTHRYGRHDLNRICGYLLSGVITAFLAWSVIMLVLRLPGHQEPPAVLLRSAGALWITNVLVFACWYWRLDAGGPHARDVSEKHVNGAFLFPQMTRPDEENPGWSPEFLDYLFLAFNTSTAFSPTDTAILSRWAKILVMTQSIISLTVLALLAARAVNIL